MYQSKRRRIKPFARPTAFDTNCAYDLRHYQKIKFGNVVDPYFPAVTTDEAFNVLEGEVCMMFDRHTNATVRRYGDHNMHVFSFANGLKAAGSTLNASSGAFGQKAAVMAGLKYAGIAVTEFKPGQDVFEQGFVVTMGGLNTLYNNGNSTIYPGDTICADLPSTVGRGQTKNRALQTGVPREKLQFVVTPYETLKLELGETGAAKFIMGTALSYSRPGNPVDVVLHKCNMIVQSAAPSKPSKSGAGGGIGGGGGGGKKKKKGGK